MGKGDGDPTASSSRSGLEWLDSINPERRSDILFKRRGINVTVDKDTHNEFRTVLFRFDISPQEILELFIRDIVMGVPRAVKYLEEINRRKLEKKTESLKLNKDRTPEEEEELRRIKEEKTKSKTKKKKGDKIDINSVFSQEDTDALYNIISELEDKDER